MAEEKNVMGHKLWEDPLKWRQAWETLQRKGKLYKEASERERALASIQCVIFEQVQINKVNVGYI